MKTQAEVCSVAARVLCRGRTRQAYRARIAASIADVRAAQTLRFLVFNLELNEGLEESFATCLDADQFDGVCDHLLVEEMQTRDIVGTYRLRSGTNAGLHLGYYSAQEFDMTPFEPVRPELMELGRACVHSQHRNATVLGLLWRGIIAFAEDHGSRYLIGCSSLPTLDYRVGAAVYRQLSQTHLAPAEWQTQPWPAVACPLPETQPDGRAAQIPKLLAAYLSLGAKICGPPAIDRKFRTIDFLTMMDLQSLPANAIARSLV
mgnify:CR=1 FL=1